MGKRYENKRCSFGKALAHLRIDYDQTSADQAIALDVKMSILTSLEYGRKAPTDSKLFDKIEEIYMVDLREHYIKTIVPGKTKIDLAKLDPETRKRVEAALAGATLFEQSVAAPVDSVSSTTEAPSVAGSAFIDENDSDTNLPDVDNVG